MTQHWSKVRDTALAEAANFGEWAIFYSEHTFDNWKSVEYAQKAAHAALFALAIEEAYSEGCEQGELVANDGEMGYLTTVKEYPRKLA